MIWDWKVVSVVCAIGASALGGTASWIQMGSPLALATRAWTFEQLHPSYLAHLRLKLRVAETQLFQWQNNNPQPSLEAARTIRHLEAEITDLANKIEIAER